MRVPSSSNTSFTVYSYFVQAKGTYELIPGVKSAKLGNTRDMVVYVPPSYLENTLKVYDSRDVIIMLDGQNVRVCGCLRGHLFP